MGAEWLERQEQKLKVKTHDAVDVHCRSLILCRIIRRWRMP